MIVTRNEIAGIVRKLREDGATVGLILGCFDIIHEGHTETFRYAKENSDYVVVALDSDETVRSAKGAPRPYNSIKSRIAVIDAIRYVDFTFDIDEYIDYSKPGAEERYRKLIADVGPTHLITNTKADGTWEKKKEICDLEGITFLGLVRDKLNSTTDIVDRVLNGGHE